MLGFMHVCEKRSACFWKYRTKRLLLMFLAMAFFVVLSRGLAVASEACATQASEKSIKIVCPTADDVYREGDICRIRWEAKGVEKVSIAVAVGGKDRGMLESDVGKTVFDAEEGFFEWKIPLGFVTSFGVGKSDNVRIMLMDADDPDLFAVSDSFTIEGRVKPPAEFLDLHDSSDFEHAIKVYYGQIQEGKYAEAFKLLSPEKITMTYADGAAQSFGPRPDYSVWLKGAENIRGVELLEIKEVRPPERELEILGIRLFEVTLKVDLEEGKNWPMPSGEVAYFLYMARGSDGKIWILDIGTGP